MPRLLIATSNPSKFAEARDVLAGDSFTVVGLADFPDIKPVPETGETFEKNAVLKAKGYFSQTNVPCIADDGGLIVDALGGLPGVHSHRWLGHEATDQELAEAVIERLHSAPREQRTARLGGFIAFWNGAELLLSENWIEGHIAESIMGEIKPGFPYRAIFVVDAFNKPYSDLTHEEHEQVNFRRKNLKALRPRIAQLLA